MDVNVIAEDISDAIETRSDTSSTSTITTADSIITTDTPTIVNTASVNTEMTDKFTLRFSSTCKPFGHPEYVTIAEEAIRYFDDPYLTATYLDNGPETIYFFEVNKYWPKYGNSLSFVVEGIKYNIDLQPNENVRQGAKGSQGNRDERENNLLLTFYRAGQKDYNHISMETFDKIIQNTLNFTLEKATERQKHRYTQIFNGNRYCVIKKPDNLASIPEFLPIEDPEKNTTHYIRISYSGKLFNCGRCGNQHGKTCPQLTSFNEARDERKRMEREKEVKTKIVSDSTLRHADQLGLRADVMAMSGGGLGQIVQAAMDDPDTRDKSHIVLVGGANDIKNRGFINDAEFAENVTATVTKLYDFASNEPGKKITLVNSHPNNEDNFRNYKEKIERKTKETYLHTKLHDEVKRMSNMDVPIKNVNIIDIRYDVDETGHPSKDGTLTILEALNDSLKELIWNKDFITSDKIYKGIQSIYRYGCNHCNGFGQAIQHTKHQNYNVCDDCMDLLHQNVQVKEHQLIKKVREEVSKKEEDPPLRRMPSDDENDNARKTKVQRLNQIVKQNDGEDVEMQQD